MHRSFDVGHCLSLQRLLPPSPRKSDYLYNKADKLLRRVNQNPKDPADYLETESDYLETESDYLEYECDELSEVLLE
jgi:hypothetical protein